MWILFSFLAACCFSAMFLVFKKLSEVSPPLGLFWVFSGAAILYSLHLLTQRMSFRISTSQLIWFILAAALSYVGNYFQLRAVTEGPSPGYATAIVGCQSVILLVASYFLFGDEVSFTKSCGVILCLCGVTLLSVGR